ncbi:MAG TPA: hypothetical protein VMU15_05285 [Anaeromyxobacter sp.]|nr:hypothetical protein [Anaeromyxobacter sp.]
MTTILTYDVSGRKREVRAEMLARGYRDRGGRTLWKGEIALATALEDIAAVARKLRVKIRRAVVVPSPADCTAP